MSPIQPALAFRPNPVGERVTLAGRGDPISWSKLTRAIDRANKAEHLIEEQRERIAQLEALVYTDDLTGLYNRRGFIAELERQLRASAETGRVGLLVLLDLDGFREVNDRFGYEVGDAYLKKVAQTLCAATRPGDVLGRLGGDEFAVLVTGIPLEAAIELAEAAVSRLHAAHLKHEESILPLRASFGWHPCGPADRPSAVLSAADRRLSLAKRKRAG